MGNLKLPPAWVINRPERTDRRDYISRHLDSLRIPFEIIPATNPFSEARGFMNLATRGAFLSHLTLWERVAREGCARLILEDDAHIPAGNVPVMEQRYWTVTRAVGRWHCLYFYSNNWPGVFRVAEGATCGYILNPATAKESARALRDRYNALLMGGPKDWTTHIDQYLSKVMWRDPRFACFGSEDLITRVDMGTDTGWKENRIEA